MVRTPFISWRGRLGLGCGLSRREQGPFGLLEKSLLARLLPYLTNAFTLSPVPGAIAGAGGQPVFVETTADLVIDLDDGAIGHAVGAPLAESLRAVAAAVQAAREAAEAARAVAPQAPATAHASGPARG